MGFHYLRRWSGELPTLPVLSCRPLNRHSDGTKRDNCPFSMSLLFSFLLALKSHFLYHPAISIFLLYQPLIAQVSHIFHLLLLYFCHVVIILRKIAEQLDNRQSLYFCPNIYAKIILYAFLCSIQIIQKKYFFSFSQFFINPFINIRIFFLLQFFWGFVVDRLTLQLFNWIQIHSLCLFVHIFMILCIFYYFPCFAL